MQDGATDEELERLLREVYVRGGFTAPEAAVTLFAARAVRGRGELLVARDPATGGLAGMVIVVPPGSPARQLAAADEAELQLLAVAAASRGQGIGRRLVDAAMRRAREAGQSGMILWTQPTMHAAQRLYAAAGFRRLPERDFERAGRRFLVFHRALRSNIS